MNMAKPVKIAAVAAIVLFVISALVVCRPPRLKSLMVDPTSVTIYRNYSRELIVMAVYTGGPSKDVTANSTYSSSDNAVSVSPAGLVFGNLAGTANVTVSYTEGNVTQTSNVTVTIMELVGTDNYSGIS